MSVAKAIPEHYRDQLRRLLPPGLIWPDSRSNLSSLFLALAPALSNVHNRLLELIEEVDPRTSTELVDEWIRALGLPDPCLELPPTLQERRDLIVEKLASGGGQDRQFYIDLATRLGYAITITEFKPFECNKGVCGDQVGGQDSDRFYWRVTVADPRITWFRAGESRIGDRLGLIARAEDLECILEFAKPAHSRLIFSYTGA